MSDTAASALVGQLTAVLGGTLHAGAERIAATARANAPVLRAATRHRVPGALREAIGVKQLPVAGGKVVELVEVDQKQAFYAGFQELGFHAVGGKGRGGGGFRTRPGRADAASTRFVPGLKFLQHAFDANQATITSEAEQKVSLVISEANK